jgi:hypothetical protein
MFSQRDAFPAPRKDRLTGRSTTHPASMSALHSLARLRGEKLTQVTFQFGTALAKCLFRWRQMDARQP